MLTNPQIAEICHEANRAYQQILNDPAIPVSAHWTDTTEEQRASVISGVNNIVAGVVATPEESHEMWCRFKISQGWKWAPAKNEVAKTHPLLVAHERLPEEDLIKDRMFFGIVKAFLR